MACPSLKQEKHRFFFLTNVHLSSIDCAMKVGPGRSLGNDTFHIRDKWLLSKLKWASYSSAAFNLSLLIVKTFFSSFWEIEEIHTGTLAMLSEVHPIQLLKSSIDRIPDIKIKCPWYPDTGRKFQEQFSKQCRIRKLMSTVCSIQSWKISGISFSIAIWELTRNSGRPNMLYGRMIFSAIFSWINNHWTSSRAYPFRLQSFNRVVNSVVVLLYSAPAKLGKVTYRSFWAKRSILQQRSRLRRPAEGRQTNRQRNMFLLK